MGMTSEIENLIDILDLEYIEVNLFRGRSPQVGWQRVFGGQVIGQALVAAVRTVDDGRAVHSLHGYFIRPGDPKVPIVYEVARYRDGASFTTRRVVAIQHGETILTMAASFHREESSFDHQVAMPDVPDPDDLPGEKETLAKFADRMPENMRRYFTRERPIELRPTQPMRYLEPREGAEPVQNVWIRASAPLPDDAALHQCVLAYASDMTLLDTSLTPHGRNLFDSGLDDGEPRSRAVVPPSRSAPTNGCFTPRTRRRPRAPAASPAARIFTRDGILVASVAQEGLIRLRRR
jgi:acyl-CoA thioesterase II